MPGLMQIAGLAAALLGTVGVFGCARSDMDRFTPSVDSATACLEAELTAWQDGRSADELASGKPAVRLVDTARLPGQKLRSFEVLSKSRASAAGWTYVVRLSLDKPVAEVRARYIVVGIDPIWIFRKEDYDRLSHWEHPMPEATEVQPKDAPAADRPVSAGAVRKSGDDT